MIYEEEAREIVRALREHREVEAFRRDSNTSRRAAIGRATDKWTIPMTLLREVEDLMGVSAYRHLHVYELRKPKKNRMIAWMKRKAGMK